MTIALALLVFCSAVALDYCATQYVRAVGSSHVNRAAMWSVLQWASSLVGFLVAFKVTLWMLPVEALGLWVGTQVSMRGWRPNIELPSAVARFVRRGKVEES